MKDILFYQLFDVACTVAESIYMILLMSVLSNKKIRSKQNMVLGICLLIVTVVGTYLIPIVALKSVLFSLVWGIVWSILYKAPVLMGTALSGLSLGLLASLQAMVNLVISFFWNNPSFDMGGVIVSQWQWGGMMEIICLCAGIGIYLKYRNFQFRWEKIDLLLIGITGYAEILIAGTSIEKLLMAGVGEKSGLLFSSSLVWVIVFLIIHFQNTSFLRDKEEKERLRLQSLEEENSYFQAKAEEEKKVRKLYHDMKNLMLAAKLNGERKDLLEYDIDYEKKYEREMPDNFILTNLSYQTEDYAGLVNFFEENTVREIEGWDGVDEVVCEYAEPVLITQGQDTLSLYLEDQAAYAGETQDRGEVFCGVASGLTTERLMGFTYQSTLSEEEVRSLLDSGRGIFLPAKEGADAQELTGREIILTYGKQPPKAAAYTIAGILDWPDGLVYNENFSNFGYIYGRKATVMYMSEEGIRRIAQTPTVMNLKLDSTTYKDQEIQNKLEAQFGDNVQIKIDSQLKIRASAYDSVDAIKKAGMIFSLFLLFMGIVNFINVIFTSIYSRKKEIAAMESIGMTQGQLKKMLIMEGVYYSVITMGLLMTVGLVLSYGVVQLVKSIVYFASFGVPVGMLAAIFLVMLALCAAIPLTVFHQITKESIVERLRKGED